MPEQSQPPDRSNAPTDAARLAASVAIWARTRAALGVILLVLAVAAGLWMLYQLRGVILLVLLAVFFAYLMAPVVDVVHRFIARGGQRHVPRAVSIALVYLLFFGSLGVTAFVLSPHLGAQITMFGQQAPTYVTAARAHLQNWRHFVNPDYFPPQVREGIEKAYAQATDGLAGSFTYGLARLLELLSFLPWFVLIPILAFFLLKDGEDFRRSALLALPIGQLRGRGALLVEDINGTLAAYIRAALLACLLIGIVCTIGFTIIGVPYALLFGTFAGLLEFIPLVGPLVVALGTGVVASFHSPGQAIVVLLFLAVLRIAQDYVIFPRLIGHEIHMHPLAVILAILCGAELAGIVGIFLAIPVVAVLSVMLRHWLDYRGSTGLVADLLKPAPAAVVAVVKAPSAIVRNNQEENR